MPKILLVDDIPELVEEEMELIRECGLGYDCKMASHPDTAIQLLETEPFDLVILDLMMPKKNGIEMLHEIKRRWKIPVIIYTAYTESIPVNALLSEGADKVLIKPAQLDIFINAIRNILEPASGTTVIIVHGYKVREIKNQVLATMIQKVLKKTNGSITAASEIMGVSRKCFGLMMDRLRISR